MNEHFLHFKKAFHRMMPTFTFPHFLRISRVSVSEKLNPYSKWVKLLSAGIIIYSGYYYYLKRILSTSNKHSFFSYFYQMKKLFSHKFGIENMATATTVTKKNNIVLEVKELPEHVKYDNGWYVELDELKQTSSSTLVAENFNAFINPLREVTPRGEIVMYYDAEKKSFDYYSNSKNIPYSTLDAVARKYVCLHKDPSIYIDIRDEIQKGREKCMKKYKDDKSKLERNKNINDILSSEKKSLFAEFKNYKTGQKLSVPVPKSIHNCDGNVKVEEIVVIKDNINKFTYKGILEQYESDLKSYNNKRQLHQPHQPNKKHVHCESDSILATENQNSFADVVQVQHESGGSRDCDNDYFRLSHEKEDLSYSDFKKKYSH